MKSHYHLITSEQELSKSRLLHVMIPYPSITADWELFKEKWVLLNETIHPTPFYDKFTVTYTFKNYCAIFIFFLKPFYIAFVVVLHQCSNCRWSQVGRVIFNEIRNFIPEHTILNPNRTRNSYAETHLLFFISRNEQIILMYLNDCTHWITSLGVQNVQIN